MHNATHYTAGIACHYSESIFLTSGRMQDARYSCANNILHALSMIIWLAGIS